MSARLNELRRNSTSRVPGIRLNVRKGYRVIDVTWHSNGRRFATSYPIGNDPVNAVARAMERRAVEVGVQYEFSARQAWMRIVQQGVFAR